MARINPKLNLNKTPQNSNDSSLMFAKNIKLNKELSICPDTSIASVKHWIEGNNPGLVGEIVGVNNKVYFFTSEIGEDDCIFEYDEITEEVKQIPCSWSYSGGEISGCVTVNNTGEEILTIIESNGIKDVPIKHINLKKCSLDDDESIYTRNPNIPITNLNLIGFYPETIPNGVYQFFVRYKIRDNFYTNWFPASKECFAGNSNLIHTIQGSLKHTDLNKDTSESFIFQVEHLYSQYNNIYEEFQIGFIISHDDGVFARSWKSFSMNTSDIYFSYNKYDVEEINIDDILKVNYDIFNVKNIITYKNKLYIANYKETDFNPNLQKYANDIHISILGVETKSQTGAYLNGVEIFKSGNSSYYDKFASSYSNNNISEVYGNSTYNDVNIEEISSSTQIISYSGGHSHKTEEKRYIKVVSVYAVEGDETSFIPSSINVDEELEDGFISRDFHLLNIIEDKYIKPNILGLSIVDDNVDWRVNRYSVGDSKLDYYYVKVDEYNVYNILNIQNFYVYVTVKTTRIIKKTCIFKSSLYSSTQNIKYNQYNTLLPYTSYDFYVHYVTKNGIVTNGYFIKNIKLEKSVDCWINIDTPDDTTGYHQVEYPVDFDIIDDTWDYIEEVKNNVPIAYYKRKSNYANYPDLLLYPVFNNISKPSDYVSCFISVVKLNTVGQLINVSLEDSRTFAESIELNTNLINLTENIPINTEGAIATYHPSGDSSDIKHYFGNIGILELHNYNQGRNGDYIVLPENNISDEYKNLIKITPYIKLEDEYSFYDDYRFLNTPGYICNIRTLDRGVSSNIYVSGQDIFDKTINDTGGDNYVSLDLNENEASIIYTEEIIVKSCFNLNFLSITELITPQIRSYTDSEETTQRQIITSINSMVSSSIYNLAGMYKDYRRKTYKVYQFKKLVEFNNTVRSSNIDVDEVYRDIYKFEAEDYYNIPTNRGIIVNIFSIVNKIYVHCEHALFVFTDTNMLKVGENLYTSNSDSVALQQSQPFEIGIQELFDSEYGYAGIQNKKHSLVTFNSYIFYDKLAKIIYAYGGDTQLTPISDSIDKLLTWFEPTDIIFSADNNNDRFFINIRKLVNVGTQEEPEYEYKNICLSYNFTSKSFISIHDMDFDDSFNSRINTYFLKNNLTETNVYKINNNDINDYNDIKKISALTLNDVDSIYLNNSKVANSVDVICNINYEIVKTLNWINWICTEINNYYQTNDINLAEENNKKYSGHYIRIYSDETYTPLISLTDNENKPLMSNNVSLRVENNQYDKHFRQYPRYNCGVWSMNDFRDIKNINSNKEINSDNKSLIYGKYFVVRLIFKDKRFKLENIKFNMGNYEKS